MEWRDRGVSLALLLVEGLWVYATLAVIGITMGMGRSPLGFAMVLMLLGSAFGIGRWLNEASSSQVGLRAMGVALGVVVIFFVLGIQLAQGGEPFNIGWVFTLTEGSEGVRDVVLALMAAVVLYWRGTRLSLGDEPAESLRGSFRTGVIVMAILAIAETLYIKRLNTIFLLFPFFGIALCGLALANIRGEEERQDFSIRDWARVSLLTILGILLFSALLSFFAGNQMGRLLSVVFSIIGLILDRIFYVVFLLLGYVVQFILDIAFLILRWVGVHPQPIQINPNNFDLPRELRQGTQENQGILGFIIALVKWGFFTLVASAVLLWLARAFLFRRPQRRGDSDEVRESIWEEGALQEDLSALLARLWSNLASSRRLGPLRWDIKSRDEGVRLAYALYLHLLELARGRGVERQPWQTPLEFQPVLGEHFPAPAVDRITQAFVKARYGVLGPDPSEIEQLRLAWAALHPSKPSGDTSAKD